MLRIDDEDEEENTFVSKLNGYDTKIRLSFLVG